MKYSQQYLFNAIPDTNHNANPTNPNRNSKVTLTLLSLSTLQTLVTLILGTVVNMAPAFQGLPVKIMLSSVMSSI